MDLPDLRGFRSLLKGDSLFRSYFQAHLNLPVFGRRFSYDVESERITCHQINDSNIHVRNSCILQWLHKRRLPYFWRSPLCVEYAVIRELQSNDFSFDSLDSVLQFKRFLAGSIGYLLLHFALAVDYLKIQTSTNQQRRLALSILQMFTRDNSQFKLPDSVRTPLLMGLLGNSEGMLEEVGLDKLFRCLRQAQSLVLAEVRSYWLRTFTECFEGHDRILSSAALSGVEGDQEVGGAKRAGSPFIHIQEDADGGGSATILPLPPLSSIDYDMSSTPTCDLGKPHCYGNSIPCTTPAEPSVPNQLKTLLPEKMSSSKETEQFELFPEEISDYLLSSLQCDSWAGSPLLEYLRMEGQSSTNTNCLLYWQGVQYLLLIDSHPSESRHNPLMHALLHTHLAPYACSVDMLIDQHIKMCGEKGVPLPTADRQCLLEYLPHGLGRGLLAASQRLTAKVLLSPWKHFLLEDWQSFYDSCCYQNRHSRLVSSFERKLTHDHVTTSNILDRSYCCHGDVLLWKAFAMVMSTCCHGSVGNLYHHLPSTGLKLLLEGPSKEQDRKKGLASASRWFFKHHIVPPILTTITTVTTVTRHKRRCKVLCKTINKIHSHGKSLNKPKMFEEVLYDPTHLSGFRGYLQSQGEELIVPLDFWEVVSKLKLQLGVGQLLCPTEQKSHGTEQKSQVTREFFRYGQETLTVEDIHAEFFTVDAEKRLQCSEPIIEEVARLPSVSIFHLLAAQGAIAHSMNKKWFSKYLGHLTAVDGPEDSEMEEGALQCKERTKGLWKVFTRNVISFKRGLENPTSLKMFQKHLMDEANKALSSNASPKKLIGTKVVNLLKVHNDLSLWMEMERYRDMADAIAAGRTAGSYSPEDDFILHRKAHAIVNCFIDCPLHPRVQVNIPQEAVQSILDAVALGNVARGLFHEATLYIFTCLLYFWKRFCIQRFAPPPPPPTTASAAARKDTESSQLDDVVVVDSSPTVTTQKSYHSNRVESVLERKDSQGLELGPILSFSLAHGIQATGTRVGVSAMILRRELQVLV